MAWQKCWANATGCVITAPAATKPKTQRAQTWPPGRRATTARQCRVPQRPRATRCPLNNIANAPKPSARSPACCRAPDSKLSRRHAATGRAINAGLELLRTRKCKNRCNNRSPPQTTPCTSLAASVRNCNTPVTANESTQKKTARPPACPPPPPRANHAALAQRAYIAGRAPADARTAAVPRTRYDSRASPPRTAQLLIAVVCAVIVSAAMPLPLLAWSCACSYST